MGSQFVTYGLKPKIYNHAKNFLSQLLFFCLLKIGINCFYSRSTEICHGRISLSLRTFKMMKQIPICKIIFDSIFIKENHLVDKLFNTNNFQTLLMNIKYIHVQLVIHGCFHLHLQLFTLFPYRQKKFFYTYTLWIMVF